jgi:hypothetical protein
MKLNILFESSSTNITFRNIGVQDGASFIAIIGQDDFPDKLYYLLNAAGHANDRDWNIPKLLGWISFNINDDKLWINEIQSDVMSLTSRIFWKHFELEDQNVITKYKSRLENHYRHWTDNALQYLEQTAPDSIRKIVMDFSYIDLEEGMRLTKLASAFKRNNYTKIGREYPKFTKDISHSK